MTIKTHNIVGAINQQDDYQKNRNYWKYLKAKLKKNGSELVSATTQLKLLAPDGKRRLADTIVYEFITSHISYYLSAISGY